MLLVACDVEEEISENLATRRSLMRVREGSRFGGINGKKPNSVFRDNGGEN